MRFYYEPAPHNEIHSSTSVPRAQVEIRLHCRVNPFREGGVHEKSNIEWSCSYRMELLKGPLIVVAGGELVARELIAREHQSAARGRAASADRESDRGRSCGSQQQLRLFRLDTMDVDCHPFARKQEQIVKFACGEQGLGRAVERSKRSRLVKGSKWGSRVVRNRVADGKVEVLCTLTRGRSRRKTRSVARHWALSAFLDRRFPTVSCRPGVVPQS